MLSNGEKGIGLLATTVTCTLSSTKLAVHNSIGGERIPVVVSTVLELASSLYVQHNTIKKMIRRLRSLKYRIKFNGYVLDYSGITNIVLLRVWSGGQEEPFEALRYKLARQPVVEDE